MRARTRRAQSSERQSYGNTVTAVPARPVPIVNIWDELDRIEAQVDRTIAYLQTLPMQERQDLRLRQTAGALVLPFRGRGLLP